MPSTCKPQAWLGRLGAVLALCAGLVGVTGAAAGELQAAHYRLTLAPVASGMSMGDAHDWYVSAEPRELRLLKGDLEEVWRRDGAGRISFERVFHADRKVVSYSDGELRTLGLAPDWDALAALAQGQAQGQHPGPLGVLRLDLVAQTQTWPSQWPVRNADAIADYEHLDAADLGDMEYDAFARKAEAMDLRAGWRSAHAH
jgi:hypothetical protein